MYVRNKGQPFLYVTVCAFSLFDEAGSLYAGRNAAMVTSRYEIDYVPVRAFVSLPDVVVSTKPFFKYLSMNIN